jgi:hypothetical protein
VQANRAAVDAKRTLRTFHATDTCRQPAPAQGVRGLATVPISQIPFRRKDSIMKIARIVVALGLALGATAAFY